jgi:hypothetical protein
MDIRHWVEQQVGGKPPNLLLHTTGAKTGQARTSPLAYVHDGGEGWRSGAVAEVAPVTMQVGPL